MWNWLRSRPVLEHVRTQGDWLYLYHEPGARFQIEQINGEKTRRFPFVLAASDHEIRVDPLRKNMLTFSFSPDELRWFGRPKKYDYGFNEMWLHVEKKDGWFLLRMTHGRSRMTAWVRVMKQLASPDLTKAYRRHRPYIHYGPIEVHPAEQDLQGAWTLGAALNLYLTPLNLVLLNGPRVVRVIEVAAVQSIRAGGRLDAPEADGLVRFSAQEQDFAFSAPGYQQLATALAEAARRSLEEPVTYKTKKRA